MNCIKPSQEYSKKETAECVFCSCRARFATRAGHIPPSFFCHKRTDKINFPDENLDAFSRLYSVQSAKCKEKTLMCAQNHQKKAAVVGTLVRKFRSIFISKSSLHIARASSPQMHRSAVELRRSRSFIPLKAASIPAKNRLGSTKNSLKEQSRNS